MLFFIAEAVGANSEVDDIEGHIRKAMNLLKKRHLKKFWKIRKVPVKIFAEFKVKLNINKKIQKKFQYKL